MTTMGELVAINDVTAWLLDGRGYQIRAGTIASPVNAKSVLADTAAELCADAAAGTTIIPIDFRVAIRAVATALTTQVAVKAVGAASSGGTAFVPLPLLQGGTAAVSTARVQAAGSVTVAAELATTTRRLFEYENNLTQAPTTFNDNLSQASIAASTATLMRYIGAGVSCVYAQVASTTAQDTYYATLNIVEFPTLMISPS